MAYDGCERAEAVADLVDNRWPGPCGHVIGTPRPTWIRHREFLIRRGHYEQVLKGTRRITEHFEARCSPRTGYDIICKLEGSQVW